MHQRRAVSAVLLLLCLYSSSTAGAAARLLKSGQVTDTQTQLVTPISPIEATAAALAEQQPTDAQVAAAVGAALVPPLHLHLLDWLVASRSRSTIRAGSSSLLLQHGRVTGKRYSLPSLQVHSMRVTSQQTWARFHAEGAVAAAKVPDTAANISTSTHITSYTVLQSVRSSAGWDDYLQVEQVKITAAATATIAAAAAPATAAGAAGEPVEQRSAHSNHNAPLVS